MAQFMQRKESFLNLPINPGFFAVSIRRSTLADHIGKGGISGNPKFILPNSLCQ
jgi:hypothetical protein